MNTFQKLFPSLTELLGTGWKEWHMGLKGRPDCKYCEGTGVTYQPNGEDDYTKEVCDCVKQ